MKKQRLQERLQAAEKLLDKLGVLEYSAPELTKRKERELKYQRYFLTGKKPTKQEMLQ